MSKPISVTISHNLTRQEAVRRLKTGLERLRAKGGPVAKIEDTWEGDRMAFKASVLLQTVTGRVDVMDEAVRIEVDLPWLLARISGKVRTQIEQRGTKMLRHKRG